jgi:hypothetical protein
LALAFSAEKNFPAEKNCRRRAPDGAGVVAHCSADRAPLVARRPMRVDEREAAAAENVYQHRGV